MVNSCPWGTVLTPSATTISANTTTAITNSEKPVSSIAVPLSIDLTGRCNMPQAWGKMREAPVCCAEMKGFAPGLPSAAQQSAERVERLVGVAQDLEHGQDRHRHQRAGNS